MLHCVYASSGEKTTTTTKNVFKEPDAKCIYLFIHSVPLRPLPSVSRVVVLHAERRSGAEGVTGQKRKKEKKKGGKGHDGDASFNLAGDTQT